MTPEETVEAVDPVLGGIGAIHYFDDAVLAQAKEAGMDGFRMYFLGRGGVLGDVEPEVVQSAFGYFEPGLLTKMWTSAKERMEPRTASELYLQWASDIGRQRFAEAEGLAEFNTAAAALIAGTDPAALPLFAGYTTMKPPTDDPAAAMFHAIVLRELRGSVHLAAVAVCGIDPVVAHAIRRPNDGPLFGWNELPEPTDHDRTLLAAADELTDNAMAAHYAKLTSEQRLDLVDGVLSLGEGLAASS